jgi:uncharacterized protein YprB with RNaseH-like and TPR domain
MRKITFDMETKNIFEDVGSTDPSMLSMSVIGIHDSETDSYRCFVEEELKELWPIMEQADALITWNGEHFDIPLLNKYYPGDISKIKSIDLMKEAQNILGRRLKLDTVANATLGTNKTGHGLDAVYWWRNGEIEKVKKYCLDDVRITKEIYDYAMANKHIKYKDIGVIKELSLDTSKWEILSENSMTFTLPF